MRIDLDNAELAFAWFEEQYGEMSHNQILLGFQKLFNCRLVYNDVGTYLDFNDYEDYLMFTSKFGIE